MAEITKLQEPEKKFNPQAITPVETDPFLARRSGESFVNWVNRSAGDIRDQQSFDRQYGSQEQNLKDMNDFSGRIPGLIQETQQMAPQQSNAYGGDQHLYDAIDRRAKENYAQNTKSLESKLKQQDFEYRQNRLQQEHQKMGAIRQYEQAKQTLRDFQKAERKRKRGAVMGNILGVVGAVVGGIFGGPAGAQGGMAAGQGIGNLAGGS